jgi:hypothetical protein
MQYIDFSRCGSLGASAVKSEAARQEAADAPAGRGVEPEKILTFFRSDIGLRAARADRLIREFNFPCLCLPPNILRAAAEKYCYRAW